MKKKKWIVGNNGIRPAGSENHCFYCGKERGSEHKPDCVIVCRTVVVEFTTRLILTEPECFTPEEIEFHKNEGGYCLNNILQHLNKFTKKHGCLCGTSTIKFIREATEKDEEKYGVKVKKLKG